jgi:hypothetical protein
MRSTPSSLVLVAAAAALGAACSAKTPTTLMGPTETSTETSPGTDNPVGAQPGEGVTYAPDTADALTQRRIDYSEALRTASLKLVRALPTMTQIKHVAEATDKATAYENELDTMMADVRFQERMIKWWQDTMRMAGGADNNGPSRDTAPTFAARIVAEEQPFSNLFTATSNTCPTYDMNQHAFVDGECQSGAPATSGVLTDPGVMYQFYSDLGFRRVRWLQEVFVCTKFPAEYSQTPVPMGTSGADYTSPWPFASVATAPINFQDTSSVICANCHTTINHIAPLFGNFDAKGMYHDTIQVMTPTAPNPQTTQMSDWLAAGETPHWRNGVPAADLTALGQAVAADPDVAACVVTRLYNWVMSKDDVVTDLATVPPQVITPYVTAFTSNGQNVKKSLRDMFASQDFVSY